MIYLHSSICRLVFTPASFLKMLSFFHCMILASLSKLKHLLVLRCFCVFNLIPLINLCVSIPIPCRFYYHCSIVQLEVNDADTSRSSFIVQDHFTYLGVFFSYEIENCSFKVYKKLCWNFDGNSIESELFLGKTIIFTLLILLIHEHRISFHFLISSSISFFRD